MTSEPKKPKSKHKWVPLDSSFVVASATYSQKPRNSRISSKFTGRSGDAKRERLHDLYNKLKNSYMKEPDIHRETVLLLREFIPTIKSGLSEKMSKKLTDVGYTYID
jgi:hypothetical protein